MNIEHRTPNIEHRMKEELKPTYDLKDRPLNFRIFVTSISTANKRRNP